MGSLMAGWDSHVPNPKTLNRSLTRDDIDTFWKSKKQTEEEEHTQVVSKETGAVPNYQRSSSVPLSNTKESFLDMEADDGNQVGLRKLILKNGWWTSSSSAFLNEPPEISKEEKKRHNKYASQFHVADNDASKPHHPSTGIST